jgi:hypothetical protein
MMRLRLCPGIGHIRGMSTSRPGDILLARFAPDADPEKREEAREALRRYGFILLRIGERHFEAESADSPESAWRPII